MLEQEVLAVAQAAKNASPALAQATTQERNAALTAMACALREQSGAIVAANAQDMDAARQAGTKESLLDRLMLDEGRVMAMADALEDLVALPDPLSRVFDSRTLDSGIQLSRVAVPLGVVAVVYEARPNVTADAAGICLKSGNACVLRGGSLAAKSCAAIAHVLHDAAVSAGMPAGCIGIIESTDRAAADVLMGLRGVVDVLVPRGGARKRLVKIAFRATVHAHEMFFRPPCALRAVAKRRPLIMNHRMAFVAKRKHVLQLLYLFLRIEAPFFVRFEAAVSPAADTALIPGPFIRVPPHHVPRRGR